MSDTLFLSGIDLLTGPNYCLGEGYTFGDGRADTNTLESLLLDGDRVLGDRTGNREFRLPIIATTTAGRLALATTVNALLAAIDQDTFELTWTPDGGLPITWDCYRGQAQVGWSQFEEENGTQTVTLTFPAAPFGRTPGAAVAAGLTARTPVVNNAVLYDVTPIAGTARTPASAVLVAGGAQTASSFLAHIPPVEADPAAPILTTIPRSTDPQVSSNSVAVTNAQRLRGTYALALGVEDFHVASGAAPSERIMRTTVTQSGVTGSTIIETPYDIGPDGTGMLILAGNLTLPLVARPDGSPVTLTFTFADVVPGALGATEVFLLMLLDVRGYTVATNRAVSGSPRGRRLYVDEPMGGQSVGSVFLSATDIRADAYAVPAPRISGGPFTLTPGAQRTALVYADTGPDPSITMTYRPRWRAERLT